MGTIISQGTVIGPRSLVEKLNRIPFKVSSWENACSPKTRANAYEILKSENACGESVYSNRKYLLLIYRNPSERAAAFRHFTAFHSIT
jgi:hypothetical protein